MPNKLTKREQLLVNWLKAQGQASVSQVAEKLGVATNTARVHLQNICAKGYARNTGLGRWSVWMAVDRMDMKSEPANIEQVSSIWHYAKRHGRVG